MRRTQSTCIETGAMRWEPLVIPGSEGKAWIKTLSKDDESGGRTALVKFDAGFRQETATSNLAADIFVVEGGMTCGDLTLSKDSFWYRPAGTEYGPIDSPEGCTRLIFTIDKHLPSPAEPQFIQDVKRMSWGPDRFDEKSGMSRGRKTLRIDEDARLVIRYHETWENGSRGVPGLQQVHDYGEEYYMLEGAFYDYLADIDGHMYNTAGSYGCRPAFESWHGDTLTVQTPTRLIFRGDYSTSKEPMGVVEANRYAVAQRDAGDKSEKPVELLQWAE
jgi:hypothetical protein